MAAIFEIDHVSKMFKKGKKQANRDIHFDIQAGEIIGLLGPNGAGKSTLIKQMVAHLAPTQGEIRFNGVDVLKQTKHIARNVSYYSQEPHALTSLKVREALYFTGRLRGMGKSEAMIQTDELIDRIGLSDLHNSPISRISGGQKRMVGIGTALIGNAPIYIFDEPTNELDPKNRRLIWSLIQEKNRMGATIILVTHNILEAEQVVDRVAVINHGQLLAVDQVSRLKQKVDQRLKFELTAQTGDMDEVVRSIKHMGDLKKTGETRLRLLVEKNEGKSVV